MKLSAYLYFRGEKDMKNNLKVDIEGNTCLDSFYPNDERAH